MSTSARHRRLKVLAAAIGVGIGVIVVVQYGFDHGTRVDGQQRDVDPVGDSVGK